MDVHCMKRLESSEKVSEPDQFWASQYLLKLCKQRNNARDATQLTKLLTTPLDVVSIKPFKIRPCQITPPLLSQPYRQVGGYRSKKKTLHKLQRHFSEGSLKSIFQKQWNKRSVSIDGYANAICQSRTSTNKNHDHRNITTLDAMEVSKNEALSEHLGKLSKLVRNVGLKAETEKDKNPFFDVLANYTPIYPETVPSNRNPFVKSDLFAGKQMNHDDMQMNSACNATHLMNNSHARDDYADTAWQDNDMFHGDYSPTTHQSYGSPFHSNYNSSCHQDYTNEFQHDYSSYPCSPAVYSLDTPLSASAPSIQFLIDDLRKHSTDAELKKSFEDIDVSEDACLDEDDSVFEDLLMKV